MTGPLVVGVVFTLLAAGIYRLSPNRQVRLARRRYEREYTALVLADEFRIAQADTDLATAEQIWAYTLTTESGSAP